MRLKKLIKKINKENAPPGGWSLRDKVASSRRGGPAHKESGPKPSSVMIFKTILEFESDDFQDK
jgi:hypothetical protein